MASHQGLRHIDTATLFLRALRAEIRLFTPRPEFTARFFLDILRQYAGAGEVDETYNALRGADDHAFTVQMDRVLAMADDQDAVDDFWS